MQDQMPTSIYFGPPPVHEAFVKSRSPVVVSRNLFYQKDPSSKILTHIVTRKG
jgi:hypothetical protein